MISTEKTITIEAPITTVFAAVTAISKTPVWVSVVKEAAVTSPGSVGVGTTFIERGEMMGQSALFHKTVTLYNAPKQYGTTTTSGPVAHTMLFTCTPLNAATTTLTFRLEVEEPSGVMSFFVDMMRGMVEQQIEGDLKRLKALLERR